MADFTKFRTSVGGFNRTDVTDYIETLCVEHKKALKQLEDDKEALSAQLAEAEISLEAKTAEAETLQRKLSETELALSSTETALDEAMSMIEEQTALLPEEPAEPEEETPDYPALELEAYRRAEKAERLAAERASRLRRQISDLLDHVSSRYEETAQDIHVLTQDVSTNLQRLQEALSDLDLIFDETNHTFEALDGELSDLSVDDPE